VVAAVAAAARENSALPAEKRLAGDALADLYVRRGAGVAAGVRDLLSGLVVALDVPRIRPLIRQAGRLESDGEEAARRRVLGEPTLRGRKDLLHHFVGSAALAALDRPAMAESAGIAKEIADAQPGGSGFSFADLLADLAGIRFAGWVAEGDATARLAGVAKEFRGEDFLPDRPGQPEGLTAEQFAKDWGGPLDERFLGKLRALKDAVEALPIYRPKDGGSPR
jgi:hypothetical protein